jgi:hypothetical protein
MDGGSYLIRFSVYGLSYVRTGVLNRHPVTYRTTVQAEYVRCTVQQPYNRTAANTEVLQR